MDRVDVSSKTRAGSATGIALVLLGVSAIWFLEAELIAYTCQISESVPPIPAVLALLILPPAIPLLRKIPGFKRFGRRELVLCYIFLTAALPMASVGVMRIFFPCITALRYFATPDNRLPELIPHIPKWFAPTQDSVITACYEGSDEGKVPWGIWWPYLGLWGAFFLALWAAFLGLSIILRRQWEEAERLSFPLLSFPESLAGLDDRKPGTPFFRDPVMWLGFGVAALHNLLNILHSLNPSVAALGIAQPIGRLFTERPWDALQGVMLEYKPELVGIGYLMPTEISLAVWTSYLLLRVEAVLGRAVGSETVGFPFDQEQSTGAFLVLALFYLWIARKHLLTVLQQAWTGRAAGPDPAKDAPNYRSALALFAGGSLFFLAWCVLAGMHPLHALLYGLLLLAFAIVYTRIRAETGAPMIWIFPFGQQKKIFSILLGYRGLLRVFGVRSMTVFSSLMFLSRGCYPQLMATHLEGLRLGDQAKIERGKVASILILGLVAGFVFATAIHLVAYYRYGANVLEGGTTEGGYRTWLVMTDFRELASQLRTPGLPDRPRTAGILFGACLSVAFLFCRAIFLKSPIHPLGFAMATAYGQPLWGAFFLVWIIKTAVFKLGGIRLYRRLIPLFVGIILGHFLVAGILWGGISFFLPEHLRHYVVHFG